MQTKTAEGLGLFLGSLIKIFVIFSIIVMILCTLLKLNKYLNMKIKENNTELKSTEHGETERNNPCRCIQG